MSDVLLDDLATLAAWHAHAPDGSPSTLVSVAAGPDRLLAPGGPGSRTAVITAGAGATSHRVEWTGGPVDLRLFDDLVLWVRGERRADGSPQAPFYLRLALGSDAMSPEASGWHRLLPVAVTGAWVSVPVSLADLPDAVRSRCSMLRLTCLDAAPWRLTLDGVRAVRADLVPDVDAALSGRLDRGLQIGGRPVPAGVAPGFTATAPTIRISNYDVRPDRALSPGEGQRTDYTENGFSVRPPAQVFQLDYAVEAIADQRSDAGQVLSFVLDALTPQTVLMGGGRLLRVEWIDPPATVAPPAVTPPADHPVVHVRVWAGRPGAGAPQPAVPPFNSVSVEVDSLERG